MNKEELKAMLIEMLADGEIEINLYGKISKDITVVVTIDDNEYIVSE